MSALEAIREALSGKPHTFTGLQFRPGIPSGEDSTSRLTRLDMELQAVRNALEIAGTKIDELRSELGR